MPNPLHEAVDWAKADLPNLPTGADASTSFPTDGSLGHIHVQVAWDGSTDADNREDVTIRFTVWAPRGRPNDAIDAAEGLRARLLGNPRTAFQRVDRGTGRLPGVDPDTGLPFCTFTLLPVLTALAP